MEVLEENMACSFHDLSMEKYFLKYELFQWNIIIPFYFLARVVKYLTVIGYIIYLDLCTFVNYISQWEQLKIERSKWKY